MTQNFSVGVDIVDLLLSVVIGKVRKRRADVEHCLVHNVSMILPARGRKNTHQSL